MVLVVDSEPPRLTCSTNRAVAATTSSGARVVFPTPSASDNCPGVSVLCRPASGALFPIGTTMVRCTATDTSTNTQDCSFTIHVKGAIEQLHDLIALVSNFHLAHGMANSLTSQLNTTLGFLSGGNKTAAAASLQTFIDHVNAQAGKKMLTTVQARALIAAATQIRTVIQAVPAGAPEQPFNPKLKSL
jgi:hypothetical protein